MDKPEMPEGAVPVTYVDNPHAPEFFASFIAGAGFDHPNVRLTFASTRINHAATPGPVNNVVNVRVVMSIPSAIQMVRFLQDFLASAQLNATAPPPDKPLQ
jgi:hypothetical protein